jgi:hypothetical protein
MLNILIHIKKYFNITLKLHLLILYFKKNNDQSFTPKNFLKKNIYFIFLGTYGVLNLSFVTWSSRFQAISNVLLLDVDDRSDLRANLIVL